MNLRDLLYSFCLAATLACGAAMGIVADRCGEAIWYVAAVVLVAIYFGLRLMWALVKEEP